MASDALPPHARLLLLLAIDEVDESTGKACREVMEEGVDWASFIDAAGRHKLLPLVGRNMTQLRLGRGNGGDGTQGIPYAWVYPGAYIANRDRNWALADEFARFFRVLERGDVRYAVRKGFGLAEHTYHDVGARRINDLDVLISRADAGRAHALLEQLGYVQGKASTEAERIDPFSRETQIYWRVNLSNQLPYVKLGNRPDITVYNIDLCHSIVQKRSGAEVDTDALLDRAVTVPLCGGTGRVLSPADQLLDLCSHLHKEATGVLFVEGGVDLQISKFLDLGLVARTTSLETWATFIERTSEASASRIAYYSLHFTDLLFPGWIPADVLDRLRPDDLGYLDVFGADDAAPTRWEVPFPERLFTSDRPGASVTSTVLQK